MAKTFGDLKGVRVITTKGIEKSFVYDANDCVKISYLGDTIFRVNPNSLTVERYTVKDIDRFSYNGNVRICFCKPMDGRDFIPIANKPNNFEKIILKSNKKENNLTFIHLEDAAKCIQRLRDKKYFGALNYGDIVYLVDKNKCEIKELIVEKIGHRMNGDMFAISFKDIGNIICGDSEYESNSSYFSDTQFYPHFSINQSDYKKISLHIDKEDAEKVLNEYIKSQNKRKSDKQANKLLIGTLIKHTDSKNNLLHIGDKVAYYRSRKGDISIGIIYSGSDKKVTVYDEEERINIRKRRKIRNISLKERGFDDRHFEKDSEKDGMHVIDSIEVLLLKK